MTLPFHKVEVKNLVSVTVISFIVASCAKSSSDAALRSAMEMCTNAMSESSQANIVQESNSKGFNEANSGDAPTEVRSLLDQIKRGTVDGRRVELSAPTASVFESGSYPKIFLVWIDLDTTGTTSTGGYSRLCMVGPLTEAQIESGLQQVVDHATTANSLSIADRSIFAKRKARSHDMLHLTQEQRSQNLLATGKSYLVTNDSKYIAFSSDALFGRAN